MNLQATTKKIPKHLQKYVVDQQYEKYTPINQAVWRYVMRQNHNFLKDTAHEAYIEGLKASAILVEKIPNVDDMNRALAPFNLGAVNIDGFIPGVVFFDFQGHGILPIASDIRKLENIQYTPAPDIIHEAAGHAPILCEEKFAEYVKLFGQIGSKAIASREEHELFDAIRHYSNLLESGTATEQQIKEAKEDFEAKQKLVKVLSEAEQISRLYWWTVEYGLIGTVENPKIYGAGLLSSVAEGRNSLTDSVKKIPFKLEEVLQTEFDITKPQPQLFVCESFDQLIEAVKEFSGRMAFMVGGSEGLLKALNSNRTATIQYSSGLQVTGTLSDIIKDENEEEIYIKTVGPTALAVEGKQLEGHGKSTHADGFGAPIGTLKGYTKPLEDFTQLELKEAGILVGQSCTLFFKSGVEVKGQVKEINTHNGKIILISFVQCTVSNKEENLFKSEWGQYDLAVGDQITSVFAGAADSEEFYADLEPVVTKELKPAELSPLETLYGKVRYLRENVKDMNILEKELSFIITYLATDFPHDWLLRVEIVELLTKFNILEEQKETILAQLEAIKALNEEYPVLIDRGLQLVSK